MKKSRSIFWITLALLLLLLITIPVAAGRGGWVARVSGGMSLGTVFGKPELLQINLNARVDSNGIVKGKGRFESAKFGTYSFQVTEFCVDTVPDTPTTRKYAGQPYALVIGIGVNEDGDQEWTAIAIVEGFGVETDALYWELGREQRSLIQYYCASLPVTNDSVLFTFASQVLEGNYNIRTR